MKQFLKVSDYQEIQSILENMKQLTANFETDVNNALNAFDNNSVVQDFYVSGRYGSGIKERIQLIRTAVNEYLDALSSGEGSLVVQTTKYINEQINLLQQAPKVYENSGSQVYDNSVTNRFMEPDLNTITKVGVR